MRRDTGGIFLLIAGIILILFVTSERGRMAWAVITGRDKPISGSGPIQIPEFTNPELQKKWEEYLKQRKANG